MRDIFLFAHQDDEYGAFSLLEQSAADGRRPLCIFLTSGDFGGQDIEVRNAESRRVLAALGVVDCLFLGQREGIGDGTLIRHLPRAHAALREVLAEHGPVGRLYALAYEGGHQDHDAVHVLACALLRQLPVESAWQFPLYHGKGLPGMLFRVLAPLAENGRVEQKPIGFGRRWRYLRHCLGYASQWKTWLGLFPFVALHYLWVGRQSLQRLDPARCRLRPHAGALLYERRGFFSYARFHEHTQRFLDEL